MQIEEQKQPENPPESDSTESKKIYLQPVRVEPQKALVQ